MRRGGVWHPLAHLIVSSRPPLSRLMIRRRTRLNEAKNIVPQIEHNRRDPAPPRPDHRCHTAGLITPLSAGDLHAYDMHPTRNKKHLTLASSTRLPLLADTIMEGSPPQELKPLPPAPPPATSTLTLWSTPTTKVYAARVMNGVPVVPSRDEGRCRGGCEEGFCPALIWPSPHLLSVLPSTVFNTLLLFSTSLLLSFSLPPIVPQSFSVCPILHFTSTRPTSYSSTSLPAVPFSL